MIFIYNLFLCYPTSRGLGIGFQFDAGLHFGVGSNSLVVGRLTLATVA